MTAPLTLWVESVALSAPGLADWPAARRALRGEAPYVPAELPSYAPQLLPPNERRRATPAVRQAFRAAEAACAGARRAPGEYTAVFASSDADMSIIHRIGLALAAPHRVVSPIDFHNSVHNAAAGYWSIAVDGRGPSTTLCAHDASFAAGLLEAATIVHCDAEDVLLVVYDVPVPELLRPKRDIGNAVSLALILSCRPSAAALARLQLRRGTLPVSVLADPALEALRQSNPAARGLPLLRQLALGAAGRLAFEDAGGGSLQVEVTPT